MNRVYLYLQIIIASATYVGLYINWDGNIAPSLIFILGFATAMHCIVFYAHKDLLVEDFFKTIDAITYIAYNIYLFIMSPFLKEWRAKEENYKSIILKIENELLDEIVKKSPEKLQEKVEELQELILQQKKEIYRLQDENRYLTELQTELTRESHNLR